MFIDTTIVILILFYFLIFCIIVYDKNMKKRKNKKTRIFRNIHKPLLILMLIYAIGGAFLILNASSISSILRYGQETPYYFFERQLFFIGFSLVASFILIRFIPSSWYKGLSLLASSTFLLLLFGVFMKNQLFSSGVNEVTLSLLGGSLQPTEFLKVFLLIYMSCFYGSWANKEHNKWSFIIPLILCVAAAGLIFLGGDFGSACIMVALFGLIFIAVPITENDKLVKGIKVAGVCGLTFAVLFLKFGYIILPDKVLESSYRFNRFVYTDPCSRYEENSGYQVCNGYIAIDNGGLFGGGIGSSIQKYLYLPESHTDFIFPIIVEEFGVVSGILILFGYMLITYFIFKVATNTYKLQNSLICYGIGIYFILHIFVNLGGVLGVIPLTGVPLPFLSYGGSFCISMICAFAVVQRIHVENQITKKQREINNIVGK